MKFGEMTGPCLGDVVRGLVSLGAFGVVDVAGFPSGKEGSSVLIK